MNKQTKADMSCVCGSEIKVSSKEGRLVEEGLQNNSSCWRVVSLL